MARRFSSSVTFLNGLTGDLEPDKAPCPATAGEGAQSENGRSSAGSFEREWAPGAARGGGGDPSVKPVDQALDGSNGTAPRGREPLASLEQLVHNREGRED